MNYINSNSFIINKKVKSSETNNIYKLINNLIKIMNNEIIEYNKNDNIIKNDIIIKNKNMKAGLNNFLKYRNDFPHFLLFELFYEKHNILLSLELYDEISYYYTYLLNMINNKKCINCTDLSIIELKIAYMLDLQIHKIPFYKKSMLIERVENINERNKFFKYNNENNNNIFIKKVSYIKHKLNESEYDVDFEIFDKIIEILIQTNIYKYYENAIINKKIYYNPIPQIYGFYHNISNINSHGDIFNDLYIEMEEINGLRFDSFVNSKLFRCAEENSIKSLKDLINAYILICRLLIPLQYELDFLHCDFKGSNILIGKDRRFRFIDFEYSYIKKDNYHIFSHSSFAFNDNYNIFTNDKHYVIDLIKLYTSQYRFCSDLLYLFLATLSYNKNADKYGIQKYLVDYIFKMKSNNVEVNMHEVLITHKLPYEAYVYSKDMDLLKEICKMYFVNFEDFILRFYPQNMINILNELYHNLS